MAREIPAGGEKIFLGVGGEVETGFFRSLLE